MMTPAVVAEGIVKVYGRCAGAAPVLRGVDLVVAERELLFLTGPSGSGKTTLLSILGCVLRPSAGRVHLFGHDVTALDDAGLDRWRLFNLGFVFQDHNLVSSLTALENVRLPLLLAGVGFGAATRRAIRMLERVGLADEAKRKPRDLSGGQRQRAAIARALVARPALILADEPTASLDAANGRQVTELLAELARARGHTVVVVTHDTRIFHVASRIVALEDGRLVPAGRRS